MAGLFQLGEFTLSSGRPSQWKVDCDALSDDDMAALAVMATNWLPFYQFGFVVPVPKGKSDSPIDNAKRFADALQPYAMAGSRDVLVVDDVLTTGDSMAKCRDAYVAQHHPQVQEIMGLVLFARTKAPGWIIPLFQLWCP